MSAHIQYAYQLPETALTDFVESFWVPENLSDEAAVYYLPDNFSGTHKADLNGLDAFVKKIRSIVYYHPGSIGSL